MKRKDLFAIYEGIVKLNSTATGKFGYVLAKNKSIIQPEIDAMKAADKPTELFVAYRKEIEAWQSLPDRNLMDLQRIEDKYGVTIANRMEQVKTVNTMLDEEVDLPLIKIKQKDIPAGTAYLQNIFEIIED